MASGPTIPISGGTNMQAVIAGDIISPADFNNARTNIDDMLSAPTNVNDTHGLNQGGVSVGVATSGITIEALGSAGAFTELQNDIQALNAFYNATTNVHIQTDIVAGDTIEDSEWNGMMYDTKARWDNEEKQYNFSTKTYPTSRTWTLAGDGAWSGLLESTVTFTWSSTADMNAFFNGGGAVGMEAALINYTPGSGDDQTESWYDKLDALGDVFMAKTDSFAGAGTTTGNGQVDMTTSYQNLVAYNGGTSPYLDDWANVAAQVNNTTTPTSVTVRMRLNDGEDGHSPSDTPVSADTRFQGVLFTPDANGSGFTFATPTVSQTNITETT